MAELGFPGIFCVVYMARFILASVLEGNTKYNQFLFTLFMILIYRLLSHPPSGILFFSSPGLIICSLFSDLEMGPSTAQCIQDVCPHVFIYNNGIMMSYALFSLSFLMCLTCKALLQVLLISKLTFFSSAID